MHVTRYQWPVGQGCFATGTIKLDVSGPKTKTLQYVYDCGARNQTNLRQAIQAYVSEVDNVDALFVSHLDSDHVSGLDDLLSRVIVKTVYIPYFNNAVSLLEILKADSDEALSTSLIEVHLDPASWFGRRGVQRVVRVSNSGDAVPSLRDTALLPDTGESELDSATRLEELPKAKIDKDSKASVGSAAELFDLAPGAIIHIASGRKFADWVLIPYVNPSPKENWTAFMKALRRVLDAKSGEPLTAELLGNALRAKHDRHLIKECYNRITKYGSTRQHNRLSMSLYSGPTGMNPSIH